MVLSAWSARHPHIVPVSSQVWPAASCCLRRLCLFSWERTPQHPQPKSRRHTSGEVIRVLKLHPNPLVWNWIFCPDMTDDPCSASAFELFHRTGKYFCTTHAHLIKSYSTMLFYSLCTMLFRWKTWRNISNLRFLELKNKLINKCNWNWGPFWNHLVPVTVAGWVFPGSRGLEGKQHKGLVFRCSEFISCWSVTNIGRVWLLNNNEKKVPYFPNFSDKCFLTVMVACL